MIDSTNSSSQNTSANYYIYGDSLEHRDHKYIDRIWKNGVYKYIYEKSGMQARDKYNQDKNKEDLASNAYDRATQRVNNDYTGAVRVTTDGRGNSHKKMVLIPKSEKAMQEEAAKVRELSDSKPTSFHSEKEVLEWNNKSNNLQKEINDKQSARKRYEEQEKQHLARQESAKENYVKAKVKADNSLVAYHKTPIGAIENQANKAKDFVNHILSKFKKKEK